MEELTEISNSIAFEISAIENRKRKRTAEAQHHFEYAIEVILKVASVGQRYGNGYPLKVLMTWLTKISLD